MFSPPFYLKPKFIQTVLASRKPNKFFNTAVFKNQKLVIVQLKKNTKFYSHYTKNAKQKGLVILLHGWEGSSHSGYILNTANFLYEKGYSIFRFNFRDHGETHHLNEDLFHGNLLKENFEAIQKIINEYGENKNFLVGFSIGGNYSIRLALEFSKLKQKKINHFFAISPSINPKKATLEMDKNLFLRKYFLKVWKKSLVLKEKFFPYKFKFKNFLSSKTVYELTEKIVTYYPEFKNASEYFDAYSIKPHDLNKLKIPLLVLSSKDDPVCPVEDFYELPKTKFLKLILSEFGGHNGFIKNLKFDTLYNDLIFGLIKEFD